MAKASIEQINKFLQDVVDLGLPQVKIAEAIPVHKSNFSRLCGLKTTITIAFLRKFYAAWGHTLDVKRKEKEPSYTSYAADKQSSVNETESTYNEALRDDYIESLKKRISTLTDELNQEKESGREKDREKDKIIQRLVQTVQELAQNNRKP